MTSSPGRVFFALAAAGLVAACSINETGLLHVQRFEGDGAVVYRKTASGAHLDTRRRGSLTIGRHQSIHVFPSACDGPPGDAAARLSAAISASAPEMSIYYTEGISLIAGAAEVGLTIGVREYTLLTSKPDGAVFARKLAFSNEDFGATRLSLLSEGHACGEGDIED